MKTTLLRALVPALLLAVSGLAHAQTPAANPLPEAVVAYSKILTAVERSDAPTSLEPLFEATPETLAPHLFGDRPSAEAVVAEADGQVVAFALFFTNFSTFLAKPGLYLEDLYVQPAWRAQGIGKALLQHLAALAVARGYGRFEWCVLDWNENAIGFYRRMGASVLSDWRLCRLAGDDLAALGR